MNGSTNTSSSPCINVCTVEGDICTACGRTLEDIAKWSTMTETEWIERMEKIEAQTTDWN